jgi:hypothetical protein
MVSCHVNGFNRNARDTQRGSDESAVAVPLMSLCARFQRFDATLSSHASGDCQKINQPRRQRRPSAAVQVRKILCLAVGYRI